MCLQLFKFTARPFDPYEVAHNFTTAVKIKVFSGEKDLFDDLFQQKNTLEEILHTTQLQLPQKNFKGLKHTGKEGWPVSFLAMYYVHS